MKAILIVKNKWTDKEYANPTIYYSEKELNEAIHKWDTTNTTVTPFYLKPIKEEVSPSE